LSVKKSNQAKSKKKKKNTNREGYGTRESGGLHSTLKENEKSALLNNEETISFYSYTYINQYI
jgi:hypothetical protein